MAQRRMMSLKIIDTDNFLSMPLSSRLLYYDLIIRADDDGFVSSPKKIMKITGCSEDDFSVLCAKQYIFPFKTGVCVIKDWRIHNYIQSDRYTSTHYQDEFKQLKILDNGTYEPCTENVSKMYPQVRLGKDRIELGKDRIEYIADKSEADLPPIIIIPLIKKDGDFKIYQKDIDQWEDTYPGINVLFTLKQIRQWNLDNPSKRKTKSGIRSHISKWMGREQDKSSCNKNTTQTKATAGSNTQDFIERLNNKKYTGPDLEIPKGL